MSLRPQPSPHPSPSVTSASDDEEFDIPDLALARDKAPRAPWDRPAEYRESVPQQPLANQLPHEILISILKFVPSHTDLHSSLLVSRQWCQCTVELLWHKPVFTKVSSLFKLISILSLARPSEWTTPFDSPREGEKLPAKRLTFPYPIFLRRLNFTLLGTDCTDTIFSRLALCTRLERLTLTGCSALSSQALSYILSQLKWLVALDLTGVTNMDDMALEAIAQSCIRLQGINVSECVKITDDGIRALAKHCKMLRRVKLGSLTEVTDKAFAELAEGCPLLIEVDLTGCTGVEDGTLRALFTNSRHLRELRLGQCLAVSDEAFPLLPLPVPAPLGAAYARSLNPRTYSLPPGIAFDHLRVLDLTTCALITDEGLDRIISNSLRIRNLVLAKCSSLSEECVESIAKLGKHLHYLHLGHVANLTDRSITVLARSCTRLRYIDLACCPNLTDMSVFELAVLPKLRRIGLVRVTNLTDNALFSLAERHSSLERIHLSYCENVSVPAVHFLLQRLTRLTHLSLTGVPAFKRPELQQFCRTPPKEFNELQQRTFCVYSGKGVNDLRKYLSSIAAEPFPFNPGNETDSEASTTPPPDSTFQIAHEASVIQQLEGLSLGISFGNTGLDDGGGANDADEPMDEEGDLGDEERWTTTQQSHQPQQANTPRYTFGQTDPSMLDFEGGPGRGPPLPSSSSILPVAYSGNPPYLQISPNGSRPINHSPGASSAQTSQVHTPDTGASASPAPPPAIPRLVFPSAAPGTPELELAEAGEADVTEEQILLGRNYSQTSLMEGSSSGARRRRPLEFSFFKRNRNDERGDS